MQRPPLGELSTMDSNNSNNNSNNMHQLLQSCAALHAVSSNNSAAFTLQTNSSGNSILPLQPRKLQPNDNNNNNDDEVNDENVGPLRPAGNPNITNKVELRADLNQLAVLRRTRAPTMSRRNERERNRVRYLNFTFDVLRQHLPRERAKGKAKKMSKVDTLRGAIDYIRDLQDVLGVDGLPIIKGSPSSQNPGDASAGSFAGTESESDSLSPRGSPEYSGGSPEDGEVMSDQEDELAHHLAGWFC